MLFKEADISFSKDLSVIGISACYFGKEDTGKSNRCGKTTIIEAIKFLLYGEGRARGKLSLHNRASLAQGGRLYARGTWVLGSGRELVVARARDSSGKPFAEISGYGEVKWKEANEILEEIVGWSCDEYINTAHFGQGDIHQFMNAGPKDKRELLISWLDQTHWADANQYSIEETGKWETKARIKKIALDSLDKPEIGLLEVEKELKKEELIKKEYFTKLGDINFVLESLDNQIILALKLKALAKERKSLTEEVDSLEDQVEVVKENRKKKKKWEEGLIGCEGTVEIHEKTFLEEKGRLRIRLKVVEDKIRTIQSEINSGVCPILKEECLRIKSSDELIGVIDLLTKESISLGKLLKDNETGRIKIVKPWKDKVSTLKVKIRNVGNTDIKFIAKTLNNKYERLEDVLDEINKFDEPKSLDELNEEKEYSKGVKNELQGNIQEVNEKIWSLELEVDKHKAYDSKAERLKRELTECNKNLAAWTYCKFMFSSRGIPGEYIKNAFSGLENDINYILDRMNSGLSVEFKPYKLSSKWEKSCLACGYEFQSREKICKECGEGKQRKRVEKLVLNIHDELENTVGEFETDSGGGQVLISFAVRLALLFMKIREGDCEVPPIVLDEVVGMLDISNRDAVIDVVLNILTQEFGVQQIFWISHSTMIQETLDDSLLVTRYGDYSVVDWA